MTSELHPLPTPRSAGYRIWIDGVGCWLLWCGEEMTFGNASPHTSDGFRFRLRSDLQQEHARWRRQEGENWLVPMAPTRLNQFDCQHAVHLVDGDDIELGASVRLKLRIPSPLSSTARITIESGHRSPDLFDGMILFHETCLLGENEHSHVICPGWTGQLLLFDKGGELWWKQFQPDSPPQRVRDGEIIEVQESRLRIEELHPSTHTP